MKEKDNTATVGDLEITPVSQAIARHLGIDLSPEGKAARNRRGIAVIVHGAPRSGTNYCLFIFSAIYAYKNIIKQNLILMLIMKYSCSDYYLIRQKKDICFCFFKDVLHIIMALHCLSQSSY